jgi:hypothetical protein
MKRKANVSAEEILKAEKAKEARQKHRAKGFEKMKERDQGFARLRDRNKGREIHFLWGYDPFMEDNNLFKLEIKGRNGDPPMDLVLSAEEVRRYLRWV